MTEGVAAANQNITITNNQETPVNISKLTLAGALGFGIASSIWGMALAGTVAQPEVVALSGSVTACPIGQPMGPDSPAATPRLFYSGEPTQLTVTSVVPADPTLIPGTVTLLEVDSSGNQIAVLGQMYDDGTHGDATASDGMYTAQPTVNIPPPPTGPSYRIYLAVQAKYSGPPGCRQSENNERGILVAKHHSTQTELQLEGEATGAGADFYNAEFSHGASQTVAAQDTVNYLKAKYGPDGSIHAGLITYVHVGPTGIEMTFATGHGAILSFGPFP